MFLVNGCLREYLEYNLAVYAPADATVYFERVAS